MFCRFPGMSPCFVKLLRNIVIVCTGIRKMLKVLLNKGPFKKITKHEFLYIVCAKPQFPEFLGNPEPPRVPDDQRP